MRRTRIGMLCPRSHRPRPVGALAPQPRYGVGGVPQRLAVPRGPLLRTTIVDLPDVWNAKLGDEGDEPDDHNAFYAPGEGTAHAGIIFSSSDRNSDPQVSDYSPSSDGSQDLYPDPPTEDDILREVRKRLKGIKWKR
jgi:hypothetical protein